MLHEGPTLRFPLHRHLLAGSGSVRVCDAWISIDTPLFAEPLYVSLRNLEAAGMLEPTAWPQWPMPQRRGLLYANFGVVFASPIPVPPTTPVGIFWKGDEIPGVALRLKDPIAALDALEARGVLIDDDLPTRIEKHR